MARLFDDVQTEYLGLNQAVLSGTPLAMVAWFNSNDNTNHQTLIAISDKDTNNDSMLLQLANTDVSFHILAYSQRTGGSYAETSSAWSEDTWHHACGIFASATDRRVLIDGGSKGTNATSRIPANLDYTTIGRRTRTEPIYYISGMIAEAAIWDLSDLPGATNSDKADYFEANILPGLVAHKRPSVYPTGLIAYWPLVSNDEDHVGEFDLTPYNAPSWATHPTILCLLTEAANATETTDSSRLYSSATTEAASATETTDSSRVHSSVITEAASATDTQSCLLIKHSAIVESATAEDEESTIGIFNAVITETATATEVEAAAGIYLVEIAEAVEATEAQATTTIYFSEIVEVADATDENYLVYTEIPPFMEKDLIDPYASGAWLWLVEIAVPTQDTVRIARNTADIHYDANDFDKFNLQIGKQISSGDGSIPRVTLQVFQDVNRVIEDLVNNTEGALGGTVKLIRVNEKWITSPVAALEANYDLLASQSDSEWCTFTLGIPNPLTQRFPLRDYSSSICPWTPPDLFKGPECQYAGEDATCTGTYEDCYTKGNPVHWGAELGLNPNVVKVSER